MTWAFLRLRSEASSKVGQRPSGTCSMQYSLKLVHGRERGSSSSLEVVATSNSQQISHYGAKALIESISSKGRVYS